MILLLTGARKNVGDYLITERARALVADLSGSEVVAVPSWESLDDKADLLAGAKALVVAGGPGIQPDMYPRVYPLLSTLEAMSRLTVPLVFLGSGSFLPVGDTLDVRHAGFSTETRRMLDACAGRVHFSVRDPISAKVLDANGVRDYVYTGCPTWYRSDRMGQGFVLPANVKTVVFTTPASAIYQDQCVATLERLKAMLPKAHFSCVFHRGIHADELTAETEAVWTEKLASRARAMGCEVIDAAYDLGRIAFYDECDLHVGYRVHAHLYFLSARRPSLLIEEDARGVGANLALGTNGIPAWEYSLRSRIARRLATWPEPEWFWRESMMKTASGRVPAQVEQALLGSIRTGFVSYEPVAERIDQKYAAMKSFVESTIGARA